MIRWKAILSISLLILQLTNGSQDQSESDKSHLYNFDDPDYSSKVQMSINPGCLYNNCTLVSGVQVSIINVTVHDNPKQNDEQHWIWSVIGRPTVQASITPPDDIAHINWSSIFDSSDTAHSIWYEKQSLYSGAVMLANLIEFDDRNDTVQLNESPFNPIVYPLINFRWNREIIETSDERIAIRFLGGNYSSVLDNSHLEGTINLTISAYSTHGFGHWLPHLSHSSQTSQVDIQLQGLQSGSGFNNSRFAIELYVVSEGHPDFNETRHISPTLDDEHTPGIFKTEELIMPASDNSTEHQSYMQWRPVVYTTSGRELSESTGVSVGKSQKVQDMNELDKSLLYILYGDDLKDIFVRKINVTFGSPEDGFYRKTKYNAWTFTFGVGEPIRNGLSPIIVLAIIAMIGALIVVFITAGIVCIVKKWKKRVEQRQGSSTVNYQNM